MLLDSSRMMSQCAEEPVECPLCMEPLEVDDVNFYPCTCGYQICRFCWHRIRTDENGLCPACRKAYPENPANFKPLSKEDFVRMKAEKRQKNQQKKQKITENRKSLGNVRVVQKNLVFVLGLPTRLADAEVLKRHEYFGKFGKILKVVVNQSTAYAGNQGPCASAYVTYSRSEDALRAIQAVNNISVEGRIIKTSLGTTKYCSHFMKNQSCPKTDCMYLHEMGDPEASFTKEEMQQGKHQEFEKKLHDQLISSTQQMQPINPASQTKFCSSFFPRKPSPSPPSVQFNQYSSSDSPPPLQNASSSRPSSSNERTSSPTMLESCDSSASQQSTNMSMTAKEEWPSLRAFSPTDFNYTDSAQDTKELDSDNLSDQSDTADNVSESFTEEEIHKKHSNKRNTPSNDRETTTETDTTIFSDTSDSSEMNDMKISNTLQLLKHHCNPDIDHYAIQLVKSRKADKLQTLDEQKQQQQQQELSTSPPSVSSSVFENVDTDNNSFFSLNTSTFNSHGGTTNIAPQNEWLMNGESHMPDVLPPVQSNEDWQAAFGFAAGHNDERNEDPVYGSDDDLGFDPFKETQKALAELIENEKQTCGYYNNHHHHHHHHLNSGVNNNNNLHSSNSHQHSNHHHHHNHHHHQHSSSRDSNNYLNNNNNSNYQKRFITMQQNNRLTNCTKLLDELRIGSVIPPRTHVPPPGFSNSPNHMNAFGLGIPRTGNKILPFSQQTLTAFHQNSTPSSWDWSSIDPAIVTTGQHCDLYASQPPPGFTLTPTIDSKYMFNNFI